MKKQSAKKEKCPSDKKGFYCDNIDKFSKRKQKKSKKIHSDKNTTEKRKPIKTARMNSTSNERKDFKGNDKPKESETTNPNTEYIGVFKVNSLPINAENPKQKNIMNNNVVYHMPCNKAPRTT